MIYDRQSDSNTLIKHNKDVFLKFMFKHVISKFVSRCLILVHIIETQYLRDDMTLKTVLKTSLVF